MFKKIKHIVEEYFGSYTHPRYDDFDLFENPSRVELMKYLRDREDHSARFMIDDSSGNLYYWDSGILHEEMTQITGIDYGNIKGVFQLTEGTLYAIFEANVLYSFDNNFDIDDYYENPQDYSDTVNDVDSKFLSNQNIKNLGSLKTHWEDQEGSDSQVYNA